MRALAARSVLANLTRSMPPTFLLTIDVEDYFQVENLRPVFPLSTWNEQKFRVETNTYRLLDLFDSFQIQIKATFFILGWLAQRLPNMVREIQKRGHEIASHGFSHLLCDQMADNDFIKDLETSKKLLEDITGIQVDGYRAPSFSISDQALTLIARSGYKYDSSYNSFEKHGRYGRISLKGHPKKEIAINWNSTIYELPISNMDLLGQVFPWGGGGYFRLLPFTFFRHGIRRILGTTDAYLFYMHPWEIDPGQPRIRQAKGLSAWRHYLNLDKTYRRIVKMISDFRHCDFLTCSQYLMRKVTWLS
jgi:polysaccharide deacetylase family protein (PEP-CTERM system associated)